MACARLTLLALVFFILMFAIYGSGKYVGTVAGVILITLLQSILSVIQIEEAGRQIIYGVVIVAMLLLYGRQRRES